MQRGGITLRHSYALMQYYLREKLWRHAESVAGEVVQAQDDWTFRVWRGFCIDMQENANEALRYYKEASTHRESAIPALMGMSIIYRRNKDTELGAIEEKLNDERYANAIGPWVQAAALLWHSGDVTRARDVLNRLVDRAVDHRDEYTSIQTVRGWVDLSSGRGAYLEKCATMFDKVIAAEATDNLVDIEATMGKVAYLERKNQYWPAQELLNKIVVTYPFFTCALVVKARQLMKVEDWEQASEITQRILAKDPQHVEANMLAILFLLVKEAKYSQAAMSISDLLSSLMQREPRNAALFHQSAQCLSRLSGGNAQFLGVTMQLAEHAAHLMPQNPEYVSEVAFHHSLRGDFKQAIQSYNKAAASADGSTTALLGLIRCLILSGKYAEASQQIEFPNEMQNPQQRNAELLLLNAMLLWRRDKNQALSLEKLDQAVEAHRHDIASQPTGVELYIKLNPPLVLDIAKEYIQHCRTEPPESGIGSRIDPIAEKCRRTLETLLRHVPGNTEAQLLLSRICFVSGDSDKASAMISACIRQDQSLPDAYLLSAQIHQYNGSVTSALQALEQALTLDFEIKDQPQYSLLRGTLLGMTGDLNEALTCLQQAVKVVQSQSHVTSKGRPIKMLSVQDHVSLYLQLAQTHLKLKNTEEARQTIAEASRTFKDTNQMGRISIAHAMIVARTDIEGALEILRQVPPKSEFFLAAKSRMANIYLVHRQNRRMFAKCFEELVEVFPSVPSFIHLGEAYTAIQEPEKAITAFEKARAMDPNNAELAVRIGRALVTTHDYQRALRYYRDAVAADGSKFNLRQDLSTLYWRLGDVDKAIGVLRDSPVLAKPAAQTEDVATAVERVNATLMMCKIFRSCNDTKQATEALIQARVFQINVLSKLRNESPETNLQQRGIAANICLELGEHYSASQPTSDKALTFFNEALRYDEANERAMLALARLYLGRGEVDACEQQCNALLRVNPTCEEAIIILADLMYRRNRFDDAAHHFLQILDKKPDNYNAMVQYVMLLRRAGRLDDALMVFANAEKLSRAGQKPDPGFSYARGLYHRYTNNSSEALKDFNNGRLPKDNAYSQRALEAMIEVYLMPDNENIWEDGENREEVAENLRTAERLVKEVANLDRRAILEGYCLVASKKKDPLERAVNKFFEIVAAAEQSDPAAKPKPAASPAEAADEGAAGSSERMNVPALVGLATALQIMKQTPKARNHLKRVAKAAVANPDDSDHYERGWLLLADIYIQNGKYDLAQELLKKAIQNNKSCCRAWEYMGLIFEKEQSYKDAADCYENAWKLVKEADPAIGYKLAFNFMKARKFVQCIDVCHKVLAAHPNYPRIKKDVLERARAMLRP